MEANLHALEGKQYEIKNPMSLVYLIIDKCSGVLFPLVREVDEDLQFLEFFADSIGHMVCKQTTAFNHLWAHSRRMGELQKRRDLLTQASLKDRVFDGKMEKAGLATDLKAGLPQIKKMIPNQVGLLKRTI